MELLRHVIVVGTVSLAMGCAHAGNDMHASAPCMATSSTPTGARDGDLVERVDVGGHRLFIACQGAGQPTIVMEPGFGDPGVHWGHALLRRVAKLSRVCIYDRAGLGLSDPRPELTTSANVSADLHELLRRTHVDPPYVLVGHSVGGMHVRAYDNDHPGEVAGMVLVDASHPDQFKRAQERLSANDWEQVREDVARAYRDPTIEPSDWALSSEWVRKAGNLGDRPLQVLTHDPKNGLTCTGKDCLSPEGYATWEALWQELQVELAALSTDSRHVVAEGSGHYIQYDDPELVIDAIGRVVEAVR